MTSEYGEQVKAWEPSIAVHFQILLSPLWEWRDYQAAVRITEGEDHGQLWHDMWAKILHWLFITFAGWLFIFYPLLRPSCCCRWIAFVTVVVGTGFLIHHLIDVATTYKGYYHMGIGGYLLIAAYVLFATYICLDIATPHPDSERLTVRCRGTVPQ